MQLLFIAVVAMLAQQSLSYMSTLVLPVAAPEIAREFGLSTALIGLYMGVMFVAAWFSALSSGGFIRRFGALRVSQVSLLLMGIGLLISAPGWLWLFPLSAVIIGFGSAVSTPASSDILARYSPPEHAPLVFSIKQTGVPVGGVLAGVLVPFFTAAFGWRGAFVGSALICLALAVALQPLRREYDAERQTSYRITLMQAFATLQAVLTEEPFRRLSFACLTYVGLQACFGAFFISYLVEGLGLALADAGYVFSMAQGVAIAARILWGWMTGRFVSARVMLGSLGLAMALAAVATGLYAASWSIVWISAVAMLYSATAISWHGVLLAEVARRAPRQDVAVYTGGVLSFASAGQMLYPSAFGAVLALTGDFGFGYIAAALPALLVGALFLLSSGD